MQKLWSHMSEILLVALGIILSIDFLDVFFCYLVHVPEKPGYSICIEFYACGQLITGCCAGSIHLDDFFELLLIHKD